MSGGGPRSDALAGKLGALRWALQQQPKDKLAYVILIVMAVAGNSSWECWMCVKRIARQVDCHPRTVQRKLQHLLLRGFIEDISDQYPERRSRTYRFCID